MLNITIGGVHPFSPRVLEFALRKHTSIPLDIRIRTGVDPMHTPIDWKDHTHSVYIRSSVLCTSDPAWLYSMLSDNIAVLATRDMSIIVFTNRLCDGNQPTTWLSNPPWRNMGPDDNDPGFVAYIDEMIRAI